MGASGISNSVFLHPKTTSELQPWKFVFLASFSTAAIAYQQVIDPDSIIDLGATRSLSTLGWLISGLLVGFGTKLGDGCTSGHGICGMARLSLRSFTLICTSMVAAFITASLLSEDLFGRLVPFFFLEEPSVPAISTIGAIVYGATLVLGALFSLMKTTSTKTGGAAASGALFAVGLVVSKMVLPSKVLGFVDLSGFCNGTYDASLMFVLGPGLLVSFLSYQCKSRYGMTAPLCAKEFDIPESKVIDARLILGGLVYGCGWGIGGVCPGSCLALAATGVVPALLLWLPSFLLGSFLASLSSPARVSGQEVNDNAAESSLLRGEQLGTSYGSTTEASAA